MARRIRRRLALRARNLEATGPRARLSYAALIVQVDRTVDDLLVPRPSGRAAEEER